MLNDVMKSEWLGKAFMFSMNVTTFLSPLLSPAKFNSKVWKKKTFAVNCIDWKIIIYLRKGRKLISIQFNSFGDSICLPFEDYINFEWYFHYHTILPPHTHMLIQSMQTHAKLWTQHSRMRAKKYENICIRPMQKKIE